MDLVNTLERFWIGTAGLSSDKELIDWTGLPVGVVNDSTGGVLITFYEESPSSTPEFLHHSIPSSKEQREQRITVDPNVMGGAPIISGTRIPVYLIKELAEGDYAPEQIIKQLPGLSIEDVLIALEYQD